MEKPNQERQIDRLFNRVSEFAETYAKIVQLEIKDGISNALTVVLLGGIFLVFFTFTILFFNIGMAILIGKWLSLPTYWGFFLVSLANLLIMLVLFSLREQIAQAIDQILEDQLQKHQQKSEKPPLSEENPSEQ